MYKVYTLAFLVLLSGAVLALDLKKWESPPMNTPCSPGTVYDPVQHNCTCVTDEAAVVSCRTDDGEFEVGILLGYCMTMNSKRSKVVVGSCPFNIRKRTQSGIYTHVPNNSSQLDGAVCNYTHRAGQLCGQCANGTSPPVYSYYPQCVHCPAGTNNWARYLAVSLLPTTLFFLVTVTFRLRATSPNMNGFILYCQTLSSPPILRLVGHGYYKHNYSPSYMGAIGDIYLSYISIWNLDFFRMVYSPFCLHPNATTLQVLSLDYIVAVYPLILIILTYILAILHYHNCRLVVWLWSPFLRCCIRFKRQWNIRNSLVDAFATFLLLSYVKFLSVSFDILAPSSVWDMTFIRQTSVLYYDGSVEYFSNEHLPYAILAIIVLLVFTLFPILLLCLYPCLCFQRCLNSCHFKSQALNIFMDAFQGCYKDGTNRTKDGRFFAAVYLITRVTVHLSLVFTLAWGTNSVLYFVLLLVVLLLSCFQPYRKTFYNKLDTFFLVSLVLFVSSAWVMQAHSTRLRRFIDIYILTLLAPIPALYPLFLGLYYIWKRSTAFQTVTKRIKAFFLRSKSYQQESLPHRVTMEEAALLTKRKRQYESQ